MNIDITKTTCEFCGLSCKDNSILKLHLTRSKKCLKMRGLSLETKHICNSCDSKFATITNLKVHQDKCTDYKISKIKEEHTKEIESINKNHNQIVEKYKKEILDICENHSKEVFSINDKHDNEKKLLEKHIEIIQKSFETISKEAINRPSILDFFNKKIDDKSNSIDDKSDDETDTKYKKQITTLKTKLDTNIDQYQKLLVKHNSSLKTHRYIKFKKTDPCFYIIDSGIDCDCLRYKFGITGLDQGNNIDDRLRSHRTLWPQLKVRYLLFVKNVEMIEKNFKMMFEKEINPNGHEIIEGVSFDEMIKRIEKLFDILSIKEYYVMPEEKLKEYNDYVDTTVKI